MTDFERWIDFLNGFGIGFTTDISAATSKIILIEENKNMKVFTYPGFYAAIRFGENDSFINIGIFE